MTSIFTRSWTTRAGKARKAYRVTFTANGRKVFRQFERRRDAQDFVERLGVERPKAVRRESPTISALAKAWIAACTAGREGLPPLDKYTVANYQGHVDRYIVPRFGPTEVHRITKADFKAFREELGGENLARGTVKKILGTFKSIVQHGIDLEHIDTHHGTDVRVRHAARESRLIEIPTIPQVQEILEEARRREASTDGRTAAAWAIYCPFILLLVSSGVRLSEARGLRRQDLFDDHIQIRQRADRGGNIGPPKSARGVRTIYLPKEVIQALKGAIKRHNHELVFPSRTGRPLDPQNIMKRAWAPLCETTKTTGHGIHSLRHFYASRLIASGQNVKEVSAALGHADEGFTLRTYGHLFHDADTVQKRRNAAAAVLHGLL